METQRLRKWMAILLIMAMLPISSFTQTKAEVLAQKVFTDEEGNYAIIVNETNAWENGYIAEVTIKNTGSEKIKNWSIHGALQGELSGIWNAQIVKQNDEKVVFGYKSYNRTIASGGEITFGLKVQNGSFEAIDKLLLLQNKEYKTTDVDISYKITNSWDRHAIIEATIHNNGDTIIRDWKAVFSLDAEITNIWNAQNIYQEADSHVVGSKDYNALIKAGETVTFGFEVTYKEESDIVVPADSMLYATADAETVEDKDAEKIDWYKTMINADDESVIKARDTVNDRVKVALLDSGVDYTETIDVAERVNFVEDYEESNPLFDDLSGHGTGVAGMISSVTEIEEIEEDEELEEETTDEEEDYDFSFLDIDDDLDYKEGGEVELEEEEETEEAETTTEESVVSDADEEKEEVISDDSIFFANKKYGDVEGLNNHVEIYSARVLDEHNDAPIERVIKGIEWAIEKDVDIINLSWGTDSDNPALHKAIKKAYDSGILIIAAAGNDKSILYPARYDEVMAVGSVDSQGRHVKDSAEGEELEVVAPAEDVTGYTSFGVLSTMSGSSIAAPQVTALASVLWQQDGKVSHNFIRQLIDVTATNLGEKEQYGHGLINYKEAVAYYKEFLAVYEEKQTVDENEAAAIVSGTVAENADVSIVRDGYVKGLWTLNAHQAAVNDKLKQLKQGIIWPDKEESNLAHMNLNPPFHGYSKANYVDAYVYMTEQAAYYKNHGCWNKDNHKLYNSIMESLKMCSWEGNRSVGIAEITKQKYFSITSGNAEIREEYSADSEKLRYAATTNDDVKESNAYFVYGMALHTMGDTFAHSAWGVDKEKHSKYKEGMILNSWEKIMHGPINGDSGKRYDNQADDTSVVLGRYGYAYTVVCWAINNVAKSFEQGSAGDFIAKKDKINVVINNENGERTYKINLPLTNSSKTSKREKYIENHFGITKLHKYIDDANTKRDGKLSEKEEKRLKYIDNASIKKKLRASWQKVTIELGSKIEWQRGSSLKIFKVGKKNGKEVYEEVETVVSANKKKYYFIGDIGKKYIVRCTSVDLNGNRRYATKWLKLKKKKCKGSIKVSVVWKEGVTAKVPHETLYSARTNKLTKAVFKSRTKLSGKVVNASNDKAIKGAAITITNVNDKQNQYHVKTNKKGMYYLKKTADKDNRLYPGVYTIKIHKAGFKDEEARLTVKNNQFLLAFTTVALVPTNETGTGTASGIISDAETGKGIKGLTLTFRKGINIKKGTVCKTVKTSPKGAYSVSGLAYGNYTIKIEDKRENVTGGNYLDGYMNVLVSGKKGDNQNGVVSKKLKSNQLRIVLTWGAKPRDLDAHLYGKSSEGTAFHTYYADKVYYNSAGTKEAALDVDNTSGHGPETTTIYNPGKEKYTFCVYNFTHQSDVELQNSQAEVKVYRGNSNEPICDIYVPNVNGYCWNVFTYDGKSKKLELVNTITDSLP